VHGIAGAAREPKRGAAQVNANKVCAELLATFAHSLMDTGPRSVAVGLPHVAAQGLEQALSDVVTCLRSTPPLRTLP
jgi:hypothetical protein